MNKTIEQTVAETILEQPFEVKVGEKSYQVASASTATLILVSEAISQLPHIALDTEKVVEETLSVAKDCRILGDIAAILILGAKNITEKKKVPQIKEKRYLCGLIRRPYTVEVEITIDKKAELAKELLEDVSPRELNLIVSRFFRAYHFPCRTQSSSSEESGELNDSIWAVVGGFAKGYNLTFDYVLYNISYTNMIMYGAILPTYDKKKNDGKKDEGQKVIKADDPRNKEEVRKFFETCD